MAPMTGDLDANDHDVHVAPKNPHAIEGLSPARGRRGVLTSCGGTSCFSFISLNRVDQGLPSVTSSLKVRAQSRSSYSRFQLHVNGGTFSRHVGDTLLELDGNVKSVSSQILAASFADYPERPQQAER